MNSYRLIINNYDESSVTTTEVSSGAIGYTVVTSPKGPNYPVLIKNVSQLHKVFGSPSKEYPELFEAETFIANGHQLYVCSAGAAAVDGKAIDTSAVPYIVVCDEGNFRAVKQIEYNDDIKEFVEGGAADGGCETLSTVVVNGIKVCGSTKVGEGSARIDSTATALVFPMENVTLTKDNDGTLIADVNNANNLSTILAGKSYIISSEAYGDIEISINESTIKETTSEAEIGGVKFFDPEANKIVDTLTGTNKEISYKIALVITGSDDATVAATFSTTIIGDITKSSLLRNGFSLIEVKTIEANTVRALIIPKHVNASEMTIAFSSPTYTGSSIDKYKNKNVRNTLYIAVSSPEYSGADSINGTLDEESATELFFNEALNTSYDQELIAIYKVKKFETLTGTYESKNIERTITLPAGVKKTATPSTKADAWAYAKDNEYEDVDVFFDSSVHKVKKKVDGGDIENEAPSSGFTELASTSPLCNFIYSRTVPKDLIEEADVCSAGSNFYTICGLKKVTYVNSSGIASSFESPCVGAYASMICDIIDNAYGGVAPMFLNSNGLGGQLSFPVGSVSSKMVYNYSSDNQRALEKKNYNPIIFDSTYGTMVTAQRTNATGVLTDWSYIGHVCAFLTFQKEVRTNVMIPQLGKANNSYYRELRAEQVSQILRPRLEGSNAIWEAATVDTSTNAGANDVAAQKAKKFIINVRVKPSPFSEYVVLNFTNYNDSSTSESTTV